MSTTTAKGVPIPALTDAPNGPQSIHDVAQWVDDRPGISPLTYAQISALSGADLWVGRVVYQGDTGTSRPHAGPYQYEGASWVPLGITDYWVSAASLSTNPDADATWNTFNWSPVEDDAGLLAGANLTVPAGLWTIEFGVRWDVSNAGSRRIRLVCSVAGPLDGPAIQGVNNAVCTMSRTVRLAAGETVQAQRYQSSGGTLALSPFEGLHYFTARRVRS